MYARIFQIKNICTDNFVHFFFVECILIVLLIYVFHNWKCAAAVHCSEYFAAVWDLKSAYLLQPRIFIDLDLDAHVRKSLLNNKFTKGYNVVNYKIYENYGGTRRMGFDQ